jgi:osmotically inducible protein OsmC
MATSPEIVRSATVHWTGDVAHGRGSIATGSGKVSADYSFGTRFSGDPGTNPEELLGASHAACFTMALSAELTRAGHPPSALDTTALVHLARAGEGYEIPAIELSVTAAVPGLGDADFQRLAAAAKENCPLSKALRAVPISLKATLAKA